jgi:hypothetical protein
MIITTSEDDIYYEKKTSNVTKDALEKECCVTRDLTQNPATFCNEHSKTTSSYFQSFVYFDISLFLSTIEISYIESMLKKKTEIVYCYLWSFLDLYCDIHDVKEKCLPQLGLAYWFASFALQTNEKLVNYKFNWFLNVWYFFHYCFVNLKRYFSETIFSKNEKNHSYKKRSTFSYRSLLRN